MKVGCSLCIFLTSMGSLLFSDPFIANVETKVEESILQDRLVQKVTWSNADDRAQIYRVVGTLALNSDPTQTIATNLFIADLPGDAISYIYENDLYHFKEGTSVIVEALDNTETKVGEASQLVPSFTY